MGIEEIEHGSMTAFPVGRLHRQRIIRRNLPSTVGHQAARHGADEVVQLCTGHALLVVMIPERYDKRHLMGRHPFEHRPHPLVGRCGIDDVARQHHQVGTLRLQHFIDALQCDVRSRIVILEMHVGKLDNLELTRLVELQGSVLGIQGDPPHPQQKQERQNTLHEKRNQRHKL